jgi:TPR repeat protein
MISGLAAAIIISIGIWLVSLHGAPFSNRNTLGSVAPATLAGPRTVVPGLTAEQAKEPAGSLWVRRIPKDAARHARLKELTQRYGRLGASPQFIDRLVSGDVAGALRDLKKQALAGDPVTINAYGDFVYWNCFSHRSPQQLDSYTAMQMRESNALPASDAEWFREAFLDDTAFEKAVLDACKDVVDVDQASDLVEAQAKQGNGTSLWLESMTVGNQAESQQLMRAAASAGSADAQFEIAFVVLGGHQQELLGTGPDAFDVGDLLRQSAEQIPQAEGNLAICEFYGCAGIVADPTKGVRTALNAAEHGFPDALLDIGPHLSPSQLTPTDLEAWTLIQASVALQCGQGWSSAQAMKANLDTLSSAVATDAARQRAEQLWVQFGKDLGC